MAIKVLDVAAVRAVEAAADGAGYSYAAMMEDAGRAAAECAVELLGDHPEPKVTVLVGPGNNGGDGLVTGRYLTHARPDAQVRYYLLTRRDDNNYTLVQQGGAFIAFAEDDRDNRVLRNMVASSDLVIDALFGIGARLPIRDAAQKLLRGAAQALAERASARRPRPTNDPTRAGQVERPPATRVLAIDCPSGLDCDNGALDKNALPADHTVTFIAAKPGLFTFPGAAAVGTLHVAPLDMPEKLAGLDDAMTILLDNELVREALPARPVDGHKGTFGKALIVAGSTNYTGAAGLAARAAYRAGAGWVTVAAPAPVVSALAGQLLEPTWLLLPHDLGVIGDQAAAVVNAEAGQYDALLIGPGLGREAITRTMLHQLLGGRAPTGKRGIGFGPATAAKPSSGRDRALPPLVIDADGLNLLAELPDWPALLPEGTILTPHPGEMARLCGLNTEEIQGARANLAVEKAAAWKAVVVLKGAHTLIAAPDRRLAISPFKTDALAKAGTGDVLAGFITALVAQGLDPFTAASIGVYLHGLAGTLAAEARGSGRSVLASDVADHLGEALAAVLAG